MRKIPEPLYQQVLKIALALTNASGQRARPTRRLSAPALALSQPAWFAGSVSDGNAGGFHG
jgi:hypothetical protein